MQSRIDADRWFFRVIVNTVHVRRNTQVATSGAERITLRVEVPSVAVPSADKRIRGSGLAGAGQRGCRRHAARLPCGGVVAPIPTSRVT